MSSTATSRAPSAQNEAERIRVEYSRRDADGRKARLYSFENPAYLFQVQERQRVILRLLQREGFSLSGARALEVGCGDGRVLQWFSECGVADAVGIDLME